MISPAPHPIPALMVEILTALVALPVLVFTVVIVLPYAYAKWSAISLGMRCRRAKALVLTYDDGPGGTLTPEIIGLLRRHQVKATFFSLGMRAAESPEVLDLVKAEGHEIGCHSFRHCHSWKVRPDKAVKDIEEGYAGLSRWITPDSPFRPPHGKITLFTWLSVLKRRARLVWWTHDSGDTHADPLPTVEDVVDGVMRSGGGVVLLHDFDRGGRDGQQPRHKFVLDVTSSLIERAGKAGLRVMMLGELLALDGIPAATSQGKKC